MNGRVTISKLHGARNDFAVVDARVDALADPAAFARYVCDRHAGVGADGLLLVEPSAVADVRMRVINADGSEAEMCGNGIRCIARFVDERAATQSLRIETLAGIMETTIVERGPTYRVRVKMAVPRVVQRALPFEDACEVDMGNPHLVLFRPSVDAFDLKSLGESLQHDPLFPHGVNLHIARVIDEHTLAVRHYERGSGVTMACGTGAVACAVAAIERGEAQSPVTVRVPGGDLVIEWDGAAAAYMTGPAVYVFDTQLDANIAG